ncbi:hypothetical protein Leryth_026413 [Lithospermum erythrorhizon]|nr:hypothetical protein Leryth_026413 [Lithospermum erythrorhizon]
MKRRCFVKDFRFSNKTDDFFKSLCYHGEEIMHREKEITVRDTFQRDQRQMLVHIRFGCLSFEGESDKSKEPLSSSTEQMLFFAFSKQKSLIPSSPPSSVPEVDGSWTWFLKQHCDPWW